MMASASAMASALATPSTPRLLTLALLAAAASLVTAQGSSECSIEEIRSSYPTPDVSDGWGFRVVASELTRPRSILFDSDGALILLDVGSGILHIDLDDQGDTCVGVSKQTTLLEKEDLSHGLALSGDGRTIYASTSTDVYSWPYDPSGPSIDSSSRRTLVSGMDNGGGHSTRTLLLSRKNPDMLLVSFGSGPNQDPAALDRSTGVSQIRAFNLTALGRDDNPYNYTDGTVLGWGLRNSVGIAEHPGTGGIFSVENSVDQLQRQGEDIHKDSPGEELNFHGYLNGSDENQGGNYGYPVCYALWSTDEFPDRGNLSVGDQFTADWEDGPRSLPTDSECNSDYVAPELPFQAHTAPLDIEFDKDGGRAFVSFHGSWNRDDPVGYEISYVSFAGDAGRPSQQKDVRSATVPIISNKDISKCPDDCFRPVGLAFDSEERLWFTSDSTGEIYVMKQNGNGNGDGNGGDDGQGGEGDGNGDDGSAAPERRSPWVQVMVLAGGLTAWVMA
jgi:glucose/arabinose dehydrogenase